jgi:succinate dehydrogenase / fumarate reductase, cytochrome b subunit
MAQASLHRKARPLSPHLQIWRWGPAMTVSILHRITGNGFALAGIPVLLAWIAAIAAGPVAYARFVELATSIVGRVVLIGMSWTFFNHFASGIRHFLLDIGAGYDLKGNAFWSVMSMLFAILLTVAFWAAIFLR